MKHLVQDFDGDGEFDNYFHLKAMSIVGNVGGDRSGYVVLNGSANWSGLARVSDENLGIYWNKALTLRYQKHLDYWYTHFPHSRPSNSTSARLTTRQATPGPAGLRQRCGRRVRGRHPLLPHRSRPVRELRAGLTGCRTSCGSDASTTAASPS